jgi:lipopolysaccharide/colanic/teichoic acid biosynthesis glycosyltransferase
MRLNAEAVQNNVGYAVPARAVRLRRLAMPASLTVESELAIPLSAHADVATRVHVERREIQDRSEMLNRAINVSIAGLALLILAPVLVVVAIAVRLTSPGPILYRQTRVGMDRRRRGVGAPQQERRMTNLGGGVFTIYKFRSMRSDAEKGSGAVWATKNDARVTPIGRIMRSTRIDELPQLFNVLKGEMNIVGPRPERPSIFLRLADTIEEYPKRQQAKPGITGWAQVNQAYDSCLDDVRSKVRLDLEYIARRSVGEDLRIMLRTIPVMIGRTAGW